MFYFHITNQKVKQTKDINEIKKIFNQFCQVKLNQEDVAKVIHIWGNMPEARSDQ